MVKKFSVGISDELAARLEPFKGKYSPTAVFQKAMEAQAENLEKWTARDPRGEEMDTIIERLRQQKEESEAENYTMGRKEGADFAKSASYDELKFAIKLCGVALIFHNDSTGVRASTLFDDELLGDYFDDSEMCGYELETNGEELTAASAQWFFGWRDAVEFFWHKLPEDLRK